MKKIYLLAFSVLLAGGSFAQTGKKKASKPVSFGQSTASSNKTKNTKPNNTQATIWSDTFADASKWDVTDSTATGQAWVIGSATAWTGNATIVSTTAADGYALFDSDGYGGGTTNNCTMVNSATNAIDLTGHTNVKLVFEEHYMKYFDQVMVYVSGDGGTTWTGFDPHPGLAQDVEIGGDASNGSSPNAVLNTINISAVAGGSANVKVAFNYQGAWDYWWFVDDVRIEDLPPDDGSISSVTLPGSSCGLSASSLVSTTISNVGTAAITNPSVRLYVDGSLIATEVYTGTVAVGSSTNYTFTATADLSSVMTHSVAAVLVATNDADASNDSTEATVINYPIVSVPMTNGFEAVGDLTHYLSYNTDLSVGGGWGWSTSLPNNGSASSMLIFEDDGAGNPQAGLSNQTFITGCLAFTGGTTYRLRYWYQVPNIQANWAGELEINIGTDNVPSALTTNILPLTVLTPAGAYAQDSVDFTPATTGTYYMGFRGVNSNAANVCVLALDDIEIVVAPTVGVKTNVSSDVVSIFPNPSAGVFTVKATENNSSVAVYSIIGENVYSAKLAKGNNAIDLSNVAAGSYIVKINNGGTLVTKRVVINK